MIKDSYGTIIYSGAPRFTGGKFQKTAVRYLFQLQIAPLTEIDQGYCAADPLSVSLRAIQQTYENIKDIRIIQALFPSQFIWGRTTAKQ